MKASGSTDVSYKNKNGSGKVGILTFHWADDYGAMLQAYGLKTAIASLDREVRIIPYAPKAYTRRYVFIPCERKKGEFYLKTLKNADRYVKDRVKFHVRHPLSYFIRRHKMLHFRRKYLTAAVPLRKADDLSLTGYSTVFVGSDQVWNPVLTQGFDRAYFGAVSRPSDCVFASYAASFGGSSLSDENSAEFAGYLKNFKYVSMREKSAKPYVDGLAGIQSSCVCDPTLLLRREQWQQIMVCPKEKDYILIYEVGQNVPMQDYAFQLATETGKKVIRMSSTPVGTISRYDMFDSRTEISPAEFLGYVNNAGCVVTNSFHGTAFAVNFNKQLRVFGFKGRSARMIDFLGEVGLAERMVEREDDATGRNRADATAGNMDNTGGSNRSKAADSSRAGAAGTELSAEQFMALPIDWKDVNEKLDILRDESFGYIRTVLGQ